jgi:hypothetical protein
MPSKLPKKKKFVKRMEKKRTASLDESHNYLFDPISDPIEQESNQKLSHDCILERFESHIDTEKTSTPSKIKQLI